MEKEIKDCNLDASYVIKKSHMKGKIKVIDEIEMLEFSIINKNKD